jgi:hypothetical protein
MDSQNYNAHIFAQRFFKPLKAKLLFITLKYYVRTAKETTIHH